MPAVHLGVKRNANSGTYGAMLARGLSEAGCQMVNQARNDFVAHLPGRLPDLCPDLEPGVVVALVHNAEYPLLPTQRDRGSLQSLILARVSAPGFVEPDARRLGLLVGKVVQKADLVDPVPTIWLHRRGEALASFREAVAVLLEEKSFKPD